MSRGPWKAASVYACITDKAEYNRVHQRGFSAAQKVRNAVDFQIMRATVYRHPHICASAIQHESSPDRMVLLIGRALRGEYARMPRWGK